jgi:hypothetical protein
MAKSERETPRFKAFIAQHLSLQLEVASEADRPQLEGTLEALLKGSHAEVRREVLRVCLRSSSNAL